MYISLPSATSCTLRYTHTHTHFYDTISAYLHYLVVVLQPATCILYWYTGQALIHSHTHSHTLFPQAQVQLLYEETFLSEGRLSNIIQLLGYHPTYLNLFIKTHDFLMRGNGPLPLDIRSYIAILVCTYM